MNYELTKNPEATSSGSNSMSPASILRFILTSSCNLKCIYCHNEGFDKNKKWPIELTKKQLLNVLTCLIDSGVRSICLSGGEPLVHKRFQEIAKIVVEKIGCQSTHLSTNGIKLSEYIDVINDLNIGRVNISCDAVDEYMYSRMSGSNNKFNIVLNNIRKLVNKGIYVNINVVLVNNLNATEQYIAQILDFWKNEGVRLSFLRLCFGDESMRYDINNLKHYMENCGYKADLCENKNRPPTLCYHVDEMEVALRYYLPSKTNEPCISCQKREYCSEGIYHPRLGLNGKLRACILREDLVLDVLNRDNLSNKLQDFLKIFHDIPKTWKAATEVTP